MSAEPDVLHGMIWIRFEEGGNEWFQVTLCGEIVEKSEPAIKGSPICQECVDGLQELTDKLEEVRDG